MRVLVTPAPAVVGAGRGGKEGRAMVDPGELTRLYGTYGPHAPYHRPVPPDMPGPYINLAVCPICGAWPCRTALELGLRRIATLARGDGSADNEVRQIVRELVGG